MVSDLTYNYTREEVINRILLIKYIFSVTELNLTQRQAFDRLHLASSDPKENVVHNNFIYT